jgi:hypothetical protein
MLSSMHRYLVSFRSGPVPVWTRSATRCVCGLPHFSPGS